MIERYQPMQPVETDENGTKRFRGNALVTHLLDNGGIDLNQLGRLDFPQEDRDQFNQLIGYSVSAAPISHDLLNAADAITEEGTDTDRARAVHLEGKLSALRNGLRETVSDLFNVHPDDLT